MTTSPPAAGADPRPGLEWALVLGVFAVVLAVTTAWLAIDRQPPEWDYANHLEHAVRCEQDLAAGRLGDVFARSSFYPPLVPCAAGLVLRWWPSDVAFGEVVVLAFLGIGMAATYVTGRRFAGGPGGVIAATAFGTAPSVVSHAVHFQLDVPLASMVVVALAGVLATEHFERLGWTIVTGLVVGLGMLTKPPFLVYVLPPIVVVLAGTRGGRAWRHAGLAAALAVVVALPWYGPRLLGLPMQVQNRSFKQAMEAGAPDALSAVSLAHYPLNFPRAFGVIAVLLLVVGVIVAVRRRSWFVLAGVAPFLVFLALQNKQVRYTLPLLPMAAVVAGVGFAALPRWMRRPAVALVAVCAALQLSSTAFAWPASVVIAGIPLTDPGPPSGSRWPQRQILDLIARDSGGATPTVSVTANHAHFSPSNFRYYAVRDGRPVTIARAWDGEPVGIEYMILKTGDVGPPWTADKSRRIADRLARDASLARVFPVIGEFPLPDGSTASVRARRLEPGPELPPDVVARAIERGLRARLLEVSRDVEGLAIRLDYDEGILRGRIRRLDISLARATLGELRRRAPALLRVHDLHLALHDVLVNPWSAARDGRFDPLDAGRLTVERATIEAADLRSFMGQIRGLARSTLALGPGFADVRLHAIGPDVSARVRLAAAPDRPFALIAERVRVGGVPVPAPLVNWVIRNFDPSPGIAARLPFPAVVRPITVTPTAIKVGTSD